MAPKIIFIALFGIVWAEPPVFPQYGSQNGIGNSNTFSPPAAKISIDLFKSSPGHKSRLDKFARRQDTSDDIVGQVGAQSFGLASQQQNTPQNLPSSSYDHSQRRGHQDTSHQGYAPSGYPHSAHSEMNGVSSDYLPPANYGVPLRMDDSVVTLNPEISPLKKSSFEKSIGREAKSYSAPHPSHSQQQSYSAPQPTYGQPQSYSASQPSHNKQQSYSTPQSTYGQPQTYSAPQPSAPQHSYSAPQSTYGQPQRTETVPRGYPTPTVSSYGAPKAPEGHQHGSGAQGHQSDLPASNYGVPNEEGENKSERAHYEFLYDVKEVPEFGHEETREGESARGSYHVLLPDGRTQLVEYTADDTGFRPKISYEEPKQTSGPY